MVSLISAEDHAISPSNSRAGAVCGSLDRCDVLISSEDERSVEVLLKAGPLNQLEEASSFPRKRSTNLER